MPEFATTPPIPYVPISEKAAEVRAAINAPQLSSDNSFGGLQKLAIPGPFATDTEASTGGVPDDNLYYRSDGTVRAASHISLDLAFALDKTLTARTGPTPVLTRSSTGTFIGSNGLIQSAAIDAARFDHDPITGVCKGLLIEEPRTNLATWSQEFEKSAGWDQTTFATVTANQIASPSGAIDADLITARNSTYGGLLRKLAPPAYAASTTYTISVYAKAGTHQFIGIRLSSDSATAGGNGYSVFTLSGNGSATAVTPTAGTINSVSCVNVGGGWYRCVLTYTTASTAPPSTTDIAIPQSNGNTSYVPSGTETVYLWGAQIELGAFATSYIPTTTGTAARSADVCSITGSDFNSFYNQTEGTVLVEVQPISGQGFWGIHGNTRSDGGSSLTVTADQTSLNNFVWGPSFSTQANFASAISPRVRLKSALGIKADDFAASVNGGILTDSGGVVVNTVNRLVLGANGNQGGPQAGSAIFASFRYYHKRLSNAKLQTLTTL